MSTTLTTAVSSLSGAVPADSFETPGTKDFWWPLIGGDNNAFAFTRPSLILLLSVVAIGWYFLSVSKKLSVVPSKGQWIAEQAYGFVRNTIGQDIIGSKNFKPFIPLLMTMFTLVLVNNIAGVIPFVQFPTTGRIALPIVLTVVVYVTYHVVAIRHKGGFGKYLGSLTPSGLPGWLKPIMFVLEFLTYFVIRPVTLALRLFGNMMAGHLMLLVFIVGGDYLLLHGANPFIHVSGALSLIFAIVMTAFELLIEFLQAFIFTLLTAIYLADAVSDSH